MKSDKFFKELTIWKPVDEITVARYRCFEILPDGKFIVQSKDFIYEDSDKIYRENLEMYFIESLSSELFEEMSAEASSTIEEAIAKHEADFADLEAEVRELKNEKAS